MLFFLIGIFAIVVIILLYLDSRKPDNFPPGPSWYPILGSAMSLTEVRNKTGMLCTGVVMLAKKYSRRGVLGFKVGKDLTVIAVNPESLREMMTNEDLDGRPYGIFWETRTFNKRLGVMFTDGPFWQDQRKFIIRHLKDFGFARRGMVDIIQNETEHLLSEFKGLVEQQGGKALVPMQDVFSVYVLNTLWLMMAGIRYTRENQQMKYLQSLMNNLIASIDMIGASFSHFPLLRFIIPDQSGYNQFVDVHQQMHDFIHKEIENHEKTFKAGEEPRDLMDVYLANRYSSDKPDDERFSEQQLQAICLDLFLAGSETTTKSIGFAFLYIHREPRIQLKAQQEIDAVLGKDRLPTLEDRSNMPYCEAIALEALRMFTSFTFGVPHRAMRDTKLCGYDIPKDTMLVGLFRGMMANEEDWEKPDEFMPERFLKDGRINVPNEFYPFGLGKHRCMGELMGRANVFLITTTLLQNFNFLVPAGEPLPRTDPIDGATPSVRPYVSQIVPRY